MRIVRLTGSNELGGLRFAEGKLFGSNAAAKQLVHEPEPVSVQNVALAVLRHLIDPACLNHRFNLASVDP